MSEKQTDRKQTSPEEQKAFRQKRHRRRMRALRSFLVKLVALVAVLYVLLFHLVGITVMPDGDMYPRIDAGDLILFYRLEKSFKAQDVVVLDKRVGGNQLSTASVAGGSSAAADRTRFVSRVVAVPGDTVEIADGTRLLINGNSVIETGIFYATTEYEGFVEYPVTLGAGEYFVLADHRDGGADSRFFGPVKQEEIQGVVITILRRNNL